MSTHEKVDLFKRHKAEYAARRTPILVNIKPAIYLAIDGSGAPGKSTGITRCARSRTFAANATHISSFPHRPAPLGPRKIAVVRLSSIASSIASCHGSSETRSHLAKKTETPASLRRSAKTSTAASSVLL